MDRSEYPRPRKQRLCFGFGLFHMNLPVQNFAHFVVFLVVSLILSPLGSRGCNGGWVQLRVNDWLHWPGPRDPPALHQLLNFINLRNFNPFSVVVEKRWVVRS